jgi:hypothetical protein
MTHLPQLVPNHITIESPCPYFRKSTFSVRVVSIHHQHTSKTTQYTCISLYLKRVFISRQLNKHSSQSFSPLTPSHFFVASVLVSSQAQEHGHFIPLHLRAYLSGDTYAKARGMFGGSGRTRVMLRNKTNRTQWSLTLGTLRIQRIDSTNWLSFVLPFIVGAEVMWHCWVFGRATC